MIDDEPKLLPCPFCGGIDIDASFSLNGEGDINAGCMTCGACGPDANSKDLKVAASEWNKRAVLSDVHAPQGWKLVPLEPTVEMKVAGDNAGWWCADKYRAMIAAAPQPSPADCGSRVAEVARTIRARGDALVEGTGDDEEDAWMGMLGEHYQLLAGEIEEALGPPHARCGEIPKEA